MEIRIQRMHLENFKCHKNLTLEFGGENATIYGDNATGKSSIYDAFTWLLFGKDSKGNGEKSIDIKPLNAAGEVADHDAVTEVEVTLTADERAVILKRSFREIWSTKRGSAETSFDGNASEYYVDGVPVKATEFKARVAELVDEDKFKLLTTVNYFPEMLHWQKRREALFGLFGDFGDSQIANMDGRFSPLLEAMNGMRLDEFKKVLAAKRKGLNTARNEIPARISECQKTIDELGDVDFEEAQERFERLNREMDELRKDALALENGAAVQRKEAQVRETQAELVELKAENESYRAAQKAAMPDVRGMKWELDRARKGVAFAEAQVKGAASSVRMLEIGIDEARERWKKENAVPFDGNEKCPVCGQRLPEEAIEKARTAFQKEKELKLARIVKESEEMKATIAQHEAALAEYREDLSHAQERVEELQRAIAEQEATPGVEIENKPGYDAKEKELQEKLMGLRQELEEARSKTSLAAQTLRNKIRELGAEAREAQEQAGQKGALDYAKTRIAALRKDAQAAAQEMTQVEQMMGLAEEFTRFKAHFLEDSINGQFRMAKFRLFREQINGGVEDCCDVMFDGVPYVGLNNGSKINVGMDIINALGRAYGVNVPIFVDNAEAVTNLEKTDCQCIRLVVSEMDKELRINNG